MQRVLRPGGLILLAEPNNLANAALHGNSSIRNEPGHWLGLFELQLTCERGKALLGLGDNSVGDLLPGLLGSLGVTDIAVSLSDKCNPLLPPYAERDQRVDYEQELAWIDQDLWIWERDEAQRYFVAGGGTEQRFETLWKLAREHSAELASQLKAGAHHRAGGSVMYLIEGRKP